MTDVDTTGQTPVVDPVDTEPTDAAGDKTPSPYEKELREENKARRLENQELKKQLDEITAGNEKRDKALRAVLGIEDDSKDDPGAVALEKIKGLEQQIEDSKKAENTARLESAFSQAAIKAGLSPDRVHAALKLATLPDSTEGIDEAVSKLKESDGYLFQKTPANVGEGKEPPKDGENIIPDRITTLANSIKQTPEWTRDHIKKLADKDKITIDQAIDKYYRTAVPKTGILSGLKAMREQQKETK